jgi:hypothetical protein
MASETSAAGADEFRSYLARVLSGRAGEVNASAQRVFGKGGPSFAERL